MADIIESDCVKIGESVSLLALRNKNVLITGASGFLGQYLVSAIHFANEKKDLNCKICCVGLHGPSGIIKRYLPNKNIVFRRIDLSKPFKISGKFDYIFHAAGYGQPARFTKDPSGTIAVNVDATRQLLELAERSGGTFVFFSSVEVYGEMPRGMKSFRETYCGNSPLSGPRAIYTASKRLGEALTMSFADRGVRAKIARISHVYGPGAPANDSRVMSDFIRKAFANGEIRLLDSGRAIKTYGYIADVIAMVLFAALRGKEAVYNVGGRDTLSIRELAERIGKYCLVKVQVPRAFSLARFMGRNTGFVKPDLSRIKKEMKKIQFTPFSVGLANTIEWFTHIS